MERKGRKSSRAAVKAGSAGLTGSRGWVGGGSNHAWDILDSREGKLATGNPSLFYLATVVVELLVVVWVTTLNAVLVAMRDWRLDDFRGRANCALQIGRG